MNNLKRMEEISQRLDRTNGLLMNLLKYSTDLIAVVSDHGEFEFISDQWSKALGYAKEEILGKKFMSFVHPDDIEKTRNIFSSVLNDKHVENFHNRYLAKDGKVIPLCWNSSPVIDGFIYAIARCRYSCPLVCE